jgi:hypothetical protein
MGRQSGRQAKTRAGREERQAAVAGTKAKRLSMQGSRHAKLHVSKQE